MRKWNKEHIEADLLDYYEGTLSPSEMESLEAFLQAHPELPQLEGGFDAPTLDGKLDGEIKDWDLSVVPDVLNPDDLDMLFAKQHEGDTSSEENRFIDQILEDNPVIRPQHKLFTNLAIGADERQKFQGVAMPQISGLEPQDVLLAAGREGDLDARTAAIAQRLLPQEWALMYATKLAADATVVFADKASLRQTPVVPLWTKVRGALGIAASLLLLLGVGWWSQQDQGTSSVATFNNPAMIVRTVKEQPVQNESGQPEERAVFETIYKEQPTNYMAQENRIEAASTSKKRQQMAPQRMIAQNTDVAFLAASVEATLVAFELPSNEPIIGTWVADEEDVQLASNTVLVNKAYLKDQVTTRGKALLYGSKEVPEDNFVLAMAEKTAARLGGEVKVGNKTAKDWKVKLGRFSVSKNM